MGNIDLEVDALCGLPLGLLGCKNLDMAHFIVPPGHVLRFNTKPKSTKSVIRDLAGGHYSPVPPGALPTAPGTTYEIVTIKTTPANFSVWFTDATANVVLSQATDQSMSVVTYQVP